METTCNTEAEEQVDQSYAWAIEKEAYQTYLEHRHQKDFWTDIPTVWITDIGQRSQAYIVAPPMSGIAKIIHTRPVGVAMIDPKAVGGPFRANWGTDAGKEDRCCLGRPVSLICTSGGRAMISRIHKVPEDDCLEFPDLATEYPARSATSGTPVELDGIPMFDRLLPNAPALVDKNGIFVLWHDEDGVPRGFEKVSSLQSALSKPRVAVRGARLMGVSEEPTDFPGFSSVPAISELEKQVRPYILPPSLDIF